MLGRRSKETEGKAAWLVVAGGEVEGALGRVGEKGRRGLWSCGWKTAQEKASFSPLCREQVRSSAECCKVAQGAVLRRRPLRPKLEQNRPPAGAFKSRLSRPFAHPIARPESSVRAGAIRRGPNLPLASLLTPSENRDLLAPAGSRCHPLQSAPHPRQRPRSPPPRGVLRR